MFLYEEIQPQTHTTHTITELRIFEIVEIEISIFSTVSLYDIYIIIYIFFLFSKKSFSAFFLFQLLPCTRAWYIPGKRTVRVHSLLRSPAMVLLTIYHTRNETSSFIIIFSQHHTVLFSHLSPTVPSHSHPTHSLISTALSSFTSETNPRRRRQKTHSDGRTASRTS